MKRLRPIVIENSVIPKVLSLFAPITINAISLFPFVFVRTTISSTTRRHETIHFQQQVETLVVGFYLIYLYDYLKARIKDGLTGPESYRSIRAEREAYENEADVKYLQNRKRWKWIKG